MRTVPVPRFKLYLAAATALCLGACGGGDEPVQLAFVAEPQEYGDDVMLDLYWEACDSVSGLACDTLWRIAPVGSDYEAFAADCGGRGPALSCDPDSDLASSLIGQLE